MNQSEKRQEQGFMPTNVDALKQSISNNLRYRLGRNPINANRHDWLLSVEMAVRNRLIERWMSTGEAFYQQKSKNIYYLSMEFLIGRTFHNAVQALDIEADAKSALSALAVNYEEVLSGEPDAALGNGGLGRLAACFLDSMATLKLPSMGYGLRYEYGMFSQKIVDGYQVETPDYWLLTRGNPWEFPRPEVQYQVRFGGRVVQDGSKQNWVESHTVLAMAYDTIIPGYKTNATCTLRLWAAKAAAEMNLSAFNRGEYTDAVKDKTMSENITRVLYPDDSTDSGRELRLRQEFFFVSASMQDMVRRHLLNHDDIESLPESVAVHLNDTHPVLAVPELMRILIDEHNLDWDKVWHMVGEIFTYTNHTLMNEALETWSVQLLERVLPRHLMIIYEINCRFLSEVAKTVEAHHDLLEKVSLIDEKNGRRVRMAYLAVVASHTTNGVSKLHSELMKQSTFADLAAVFPERFANVTNGITPRRWMSQSNPLLSALIDKTIGGEWRRDFGQLSKLLPHKARPEFVDAFLSAKKQNKQRLAEWIQSNLHISVSPDSLFDVQIKRIHEYKRQLMNVLHVITRYNRILENPSADWVPRTVIFAGKAASAYHMAKLIIKLINDVADKVNNDPIVGDKLKVIFIPNYGVSMAEMIIPAADLSEQISTAGTEASGTGNMKMACNGALTIGTLDGANVEIREAVGADNVFIFGKTTEEVAATRSHGYAPRAIYEQNAELKLALNQIRDGEFSPDEPRRFQDVFDSLVNYGDHYLVLADYASYVLAQEVADALYCQPLKWADKAIQNVARMGAFSSDRSVAEYAARIWGIEPLEIDENVDNHRINCAAFQGES